MCNPSRRHRRQCRGSPLGTNIPTGKGIADAIPARETCSIFRRTRGKGRPGEGSQLMTSLARSMSPFVTPVCTRTVSPGAIRASRVANRFECHSDSPPRSTATSHQSPTSSMSNAAPSPTLVTATAPINIGLSGETAVFTFSCCSNANAGRGLSNHRIARVTSAETTAATGMTLHHDGSISASLSALPAVIR